MALLLLLEYIKAVIREDISDIVTGLELTMKDLHILFVPLWDIHVSKHCIIFSD